jgi:hypothetical protein
MDVYRKSTHSANQLRNQLRLELSQTTSDEMATTWFAWACELSKQKRPQEFHDSTILELVGHLVCARLIQQDLQVGTGAGLERASASISTRFGIRRGPELYRLYIWLNDHQRRAVEDVLLGQLFFPHGVCDGPSGEGNSFERGWAFQQFDLYLGRRAANAWKRWSEEVSKKCLGPRASRNEVLGLLMNLIAVKSDERSFVTELESIHEKRLTGMTAGSSPSWV